MITIHIKPTATISFLNIWFCCLFRWQDGSHLWALALQKRKEGRCPLEPGEVAVLLRAMGYPKETQIYVASGQVYGGQNRMAPLRNMFPNLVSYLPKLLIKGKGPLSIFCSGSIFL